MKPANDEPGLVEPHWYSENEELKREVIASGIPDYIVEFMCQVADGLGADQVEFYDAAAFTPPSWVMIVTVDGIPGNVGVAKTTTKEECGKEDINQMIANIRGIRNAAIGSGEFEPGGRLQ